jgi:predicted ATPase
VEKKQRVHFHRFMQDVHHRLRDLHRPGRAIEADCRRRRARDAPIVPR